MANDNSPDLATSLARARAFADSWDDADTIDEESGLTVADLRAVIAAAEASTPIPRL